MTMEMKKDWMDPRTIVQDFVPNEYVAACGDTGTVYKFQCTAPAGVVRDANGNQLSGVGFLYPSYHPCNAEHEASTTDDFERGTLTYTAFSIPPVKTVDVIIWKGEDGHNLHCTTNLDINSWEVAKS